MGRCGVHATSMPGGTLTGFWGSRGLAGGLNNPLGLESGDQRKSYSERWCRGTTAWPSAMGAPAGLRRLGHPTALFEAYAQLNSRLFCYFHNFISYFVCAQCLNVTILAKARPRTYTSAARRRLHPAFVQLQVNPTGLTFPVAGMLQPGANPTLPMPGMLSHPPALFGVIFGALSPAPGDGSAGCGCSPCLRLWCHLVPSTGCFQTAFSELKCRWPNWIKNRR